MSGEPLRLMYVDTFLIPPTLIPPTLNAGFKPQIRSSDPLALLYNDSSPMENHHVAAAFTLLREGQYNFMGRSSQKVCWLVGNG